MKSILLIIILCGLTSAQTVLRWSGGDAGGDDVIYEVYFGKTGLPPLVSIQPDTCYFPGTLEYKTRYYWLIVNIDKHGLRTPGPLWHFETLDGFDINEPQPYLIIDKK